MEEIKRKSNKWLIVLLVVLIILLLSAISYICYDKGLLNFNNKATPKEQSKQEKSKEDSLNYEDSKIIDTGNYKDGEEYDSLIIKVNGEWYEVANNSIHYEIFGEYNKKLYYADDDAFKYIDLSTKDFPSVTWIKYEEKCYSDDNNLVGYAYADKGTIKDDTIYFIKNSFGWNNENDSYLYSLKLNATSYSDIEKEFKQEGIIDFEIRENLIYYYNWEDEIPSTKTLRAYNLDTKETKTLLKNIEGIELYEKKAIYSQSVGNGDNSNYKWYLYNLTTGNKTFITEISGDSISGMFQLYNNAVYYVDNDTIMKYQNGKQEKIYKLDNIRHGGQGGGVEVINDNLFDYSSLATDEYGYILNGKKATKNEVDQYLEKYNVHMKDGQQKVFYKKGRAY